MDDEPTTIFGMANRRVIQQELDRVAETRSNRLDGEVQADLQTGELSATVSAHKSWRNGWGLMGWFGWRKREGPDDKLAGARVTKEF